MKTHFLIPFLSLLSICSLKLSAQMEWAPVGAKWHYELPYNYGNAETYLKIESIGDTVINGISCKILEQVCVRDPYLNREYYTYKSNDIVWVYDGDEFRVLYDFTVQPQGEWTAYGPSLYHTCDTVTNLVVEFEGYEEILGTSYRYVIVTLPEFGWSFSICGSEQTKISEKFGSYGYMFPQDICVIDAPYPCFLRCYEDSEFGFYSTGVSDSCTYEYGVGIKELQLANNIKVGPNPVSGILNIELIGLVDKSVFWIYSSTGKLIFNAAITDNYTKIDMSTFSKGNYILKIYHEGNFSAGKIIKL